MSKNHSAWILRGLLCLSILSIPLTVYADVEHARQESQGHCIGLLWCTEQSAQGRSVDGLLWLYSSEERGAYSRLAIRPFYSSEEDPTKHLLRHSILWPLGTSERRGDQIWSHVFPLYWHREEPGHEWTFIAPLYWKSIHAEDSWFHLFPLFSRHTMGEFYAKNFVLGPLLMTVRNSWTDLTQWDLLLSLFHYRQGANLSESWVAPIYWAGEDRTSGTAYRYVFPFYGSSDSGTQHYHFLFPFYGSDVDTAKQTSRLALFGLPPFKGAFGTPTLSLFESATSVDESSHRLFPVYRSVSRTDDTSTFDALLLYRHQSSPTGSVDRLFPLYRYENDGVLQTREFDLFGYRAASWFRYQSGAAYAQHRLLGLYNYDQSQDGSRFLSFVGYRRASLYLHRSQEELTEDRLLLLHDYFRRGESNSLSLLGVSEAALFRQESSPSLFRHRLFPLYRYSHDLVSDETEYDALLLYRHLATPTRVADRLLPMWDYTSSRERDAWSLSLLGMDAAALYYHRKSDQATTDHLLPLYGLRTQVDGSSRLSVLGLPPIADAPAWALYERTSSPAMTSERLFPLYRRSHDVAADATTINVAGMEPVSLFRYHTTPTTTSHHLIPLYGYHRGADSTETSALGLPALSLYQASNTPRMQRHRLFPIYSYTKDHHQDEQSLSAFWLFWQTTSPTNSQTSLFPLTSWSTNEATGERTWSLIGLDPAIPVSWIRHSHGPDHARAFFAPFYDYQREGSRTALSIGGLSHLALYRSEDSPTDHSHRLFPLYRYHHNLAQDISSLNVLLAYQQERSPDHASDALFPLWQYERRIDRDESRFNALGIGRLSLYDHHREPGRTSDRLFPLYRYAAHDATGESNFSLLWPLVDYKTYAGTITSASLLWWLIAYDRPDREHSNFHILGGSKMAIVRRVASPNESVFELNPIIPLYRYRSIPGGNTSWDLCYGLVGADWTRDRTRVTLLWVSL